MFFRWFIVFGLLLGWCSWWLNFGRGSLILSSVGGRISVEAWFSTALDIEEVLSGIVDSDVSVFVADVIKSFDTDDGCPLSMMFIVALYLPWCRYLSAQVGLSLS